MKACQEVVRRIIADPVWMDEDEDEDEDEKEEDEKHEINETTKLEKQHKHENEQKLPGFEGNNEMGEENAKEAEAEVAEESFNLASLEQVKRRAQDKIDALSLHLVPMGEMWRSCQWIMTGVDPARTFDVPHEEQVESAAGQMPGKQEEDEKLDGEAKASPTEIAKAIDVEEKGAAPTATEGAGPYTATTGRETPPAANNVQLLDPRVDALIDGVLSDADPLIASKEYWQAISESAKGPIASARNRAYGTAVSMAELKKKKAPAALAKRDEHSSSIGNLKLSGDRSLTLEDIEQMIKYRVTSPGLDAETLCSLLLGRGAAVRIPVRHYLVEDVYTL